MPQITVKMKVEIRPSVLRGSVAAPPSKSHVHRLLIAAALARGESRITGAAESEDILATVDCLGALGASVSVAGNAFSVRGCGGAPHAGDILHCRESGSTLRFLIPVALAGGGGVFSGSERLIERGVGVYRDLLAPRGVSFAVGSGTVSAHGRLRAGDFEIPGDVSSQFISGMLFALPLVGGDSRITVIPPFESRAYVDMTVAALKCAGVTVERPGEREFFIPGGQEYRPISAEAEGDWSQAAFLYALGDGVNVTGLDPESLQGDRVCLPLLRRIANGYTEAELSDCPDLAPALFAAAAISGHGAHFCGTRRLAIKESRRADAMAEELAKFGARLTVDDDSVDVAPGGIRTPGSVLSSHGDHRIVMALAACAVRVGGVIDGAEAVRKSYPAFFSDMAALGADIKVLKNA